MWNDPHIAPFLLDIAQRLQKLFGSYRIGSHTVGVVGESNWTSRVCGSKATEGKLNWRPPTLFFLRSVAPPEITTGHIYVGIIPFVLIQLCALVVLWFAPGLATWLPHRLYGP